ncbi:uncharacterized protein LOC111115930 [Crassostrea virginica]
MLTSTVLPSLTLTCNCILVNILLRSSQAVVFRSESSFRRPNLTDLLVTERLLAGHAGVESTIHCSVLCVENPLCVSFFYSPPSAQCRLHSVVLGYVFEPRTDNGSMYFVLQRGNGFIGDFCSQNLGCGTVNSECRGGQCWCEPGYSFNPRMKSCDANCTAGYGGDYTLHRRHFLHLHNKEEYFNITLTQCRDLCTSTDSFICRTFEYGYLSQKCGLQEVTYLDVPNNWYEDIYYFEWDYYQRDCL